MQTFIMYICAEYWGIKISLAIAEFLDGNARMESTKICK